MKLARITVLAACTFLTHTATVNSSELLTMGVSKWPGMLTVRLSIEPDADNRALTVTAEAPTFYHSSQVQLEGSRAPRTTVFELRGLPSEIYQVRGVLVGTNGPRATAFQLVIVAPEPIRRRKPR